MDESRQAAALDAWDGLPVLVVGDVMVDEWRFADAERVSREAPAPVLTLRRHRVCAGGAGNAAANLAALGARAALAAVVGADPAGERLAARLAADRVEDRTIRVRGRSTPVKRRFLASGQIVAREDEAGGGPLPPSAVRALLDTLDRAPERLLVVADYGLGGLPEPVRRWLVRHRDRFDLVALDAHDLRPWRDLAPTVMAPSLAETGLARPADAVARRLRGEFGAEVVAVTLGSEGAVVAGADGTYTTRAAPAPEAHTVGAGDAYLAAMTLALAAGVPVEAAAEVAQAAAAVGVACEGTCVCDAEPLRAALTGRATLVDPDGLDRIVRRRRAGGARVVFTNGCFDVLHRGHVSYLRQARELGDLLVVAVNSDAGVRRLKGPGRPVVPVEDRVAVLAALSCVDHVVVFEEESPAALIERVRPDLYVKGGDYPPELVPEAALVRRLGGEVRTLGYVPDRSTSAIIDRIRSQHREFTP
ncbi:D-glycero-beta-D-manno-heptose 1-phosphate adenylyltransferase [Phytohabitans sp. ZYX-F-186]|uniref:D-glycero-beta-D-manno-heptose 1-phosphate adenylyltransferase n=1 Tax=Phytohabitans maris TaxID=3071409 RepID=A0ABU0ZD24_9ACTN|nr:D-glycero-beta-D-manno-heptose 1-phosphate adenylyltransferase [Phytohabitans sp. ZYX-F-186]MDQ7904965.1 D-glycero-beta-D-manno-heptose 1-phosphate adenylyltransferase [Phytohabitans sp. ZYX-F-186]